MKLKLTPTRISLLALGAFAAVVAQELTRSDAKTPSATPNNAKSKRNPTAVPASLPSSAMALSQPESLFSAETPPLVPNPAASSSPKNSLKEAPQLNFATPTLRQPPQVSVTPNRLRVVDVNQLPIDALVDATLNLANTAPPPPPRIAAASGVDEEPTPQKVTAANNTQNTQNNKVAKDIQGHRAQAHITALMQQGIMKGYSDGTFRPNEKITDAQFRAVVNQASNQSKSLATLRRPRDIVSRADAATYIHRQLQRTNPIESEALIAKTATPLPKLASAEIAPIAQSSPLPPALAQSSPLPPTTSPSFTFETVQNTASADAADADSYTLGAGDRVRVEIFNVPEYSKEYTVLVNGTLTLHRAGSLSVSGLTLRQAQSAIAARYARLLKSPVVDLSLMASRPLNLAIAGEVSKPGTYSLTATDGKFPTVTKLIREAGGMNRSANARQVIVRRPQRSGPDQQIRLDMWELFTTGNIRQDLTLRDGDSVFIPASNTVNLAEATQMADANFSVSSAQPVSIAIVGEVLRPGPYTLKDKTPTLSAAIREAGGIKQLANLKEVKVSRTTRTGTPQSISVDLWQLLKSGDLNQDLVLQQGDTITIPTALAINPEQARELGDASFAGSVKITVVGEVIRPGQIEVPMNTPLNQALLNAGGFTRQANRRRVELVRLNPNGSVTRRDVSIDLSRGIDEKGNPLLQNGDVLVVDRSGAAKAGDTLENILRPVFQVLPFRFLFGL